MMGEEKETGNRE